MIVLHGFVCSDLEINRDLWIEGDVREECGMPLLADLQIGRSIKIHPIPETGEF